MIHIRTSKFPIIKDRILHFSQLRMPNSLRLRKMRQWIWRFAKKWEDGLIIFLWKQESLCKIYLELDQIWACISEGDGLSQSRRTLSAELGTVSMRVSFLSTLCLYVDCRASHQMINNLAFQEEEFGELEMIRLWLYI